MVYRDIDRPANLHSLTTTGQWIEWANTENLFPPVAPVVEGTCEICYGAVGPLNEGGWWDTCQHCSGYRDDLDGVVPIAYSLTNGLESLLHRYKDWTPHDSYRWMAFPLASVLRAFLRQHLSCIDERFGEIDLGAVVPGNNANRGFSPIGQVLAKFNEWPVDWQPETLQKARDGRPMRGVADATYFSVNEEIDVRGKTILLLDDTWTSGSTIASAAASLKAAGADTVVALTIGRQVHAGWGSGSLLVEASEARVFNTERCVLCG